MYVCMYVWNRGYKYLLTCIDVLSKYVWVVPLQTKARAALVAAFKKYFDKDVNLRDCKQMLVLNSKLKLFKQFSKKKRFVMS